METKICPVCKIEFKKTNKVYCSRACYASVPKSIETRAKMSGPKPWMLGENNPNYGGVYTHDPIIYKKMCDASKERGQVWDDEHKKQHSLTMLGPSNAMRGKTHSAETIEKISKTKKLQYQNGEVKLNLKSSRISKAEKEIAIHFNELNINYKKQFHIKGVSYWYDFYLPDINLIIEYQGDYWHANPNKYPSGTMLTFIKVGAKLVDDIWLKDKLKKELAEQNGYYIKYIWEADYKKLGMKVVDECIKS